MPDLPDFGDLPNIHPDAFRVIDSAALSGPGKAGHPPRILLLYGSLRDVSYSRKIAEECARLLTAFGCETRIFNPSGLPLTDDADADHPKVQELRDLAVWSEGMVWSSPERHGAMTGIMKLQIDWLPLSLKGGIRTTQGKTLAVLQVSGGSQSFNAVNQMRILGRWMRMVTIPNQSSIPKAWLEFKKGDRLPDGPFYRRVVDVMEELVKFTYLVRGQKDYLVDRYSERVESVEDVHKRVSIKV
ncbi:arsenical resistance protein ArsH [Falsiphaeobacter marinintestinus]|uniref:arsenical resistance protein ArsH n=1 Tax=Falsiphaeobacter marinintestinus TaxID=1492905 RepID=UPI002482C091|nr:arsenical resistance protein ArsH [Phaeobacter marinintestinus]